MCKELKELSYEERLREMKLSSTGDMIQVFKIHVLTRKDKVQTEAVLILSWVLEETLVKMCGRRQSNVGATVVSMHTM